MIDLNTRGKIKLDISSSLRNILENREMDVSKKEDNSLVTEIDILVSNIFKSYLESNQEVHFYSEEDHEELLFPSFILDPIDGTRELVKLIPECAVSLGYLEKGSLDKGWGWIFNPFTGLDISCDIDFFPLNGRHQGKLVGMVSRSEWKRGLYAGYDESKVTLCPKGSIAYKLGLLAVGAIDFVITKRPKNIWDIAGGSILCHKRGFKLYIDKKEVSKLDTKRIDGPMIWCKDEDRDMLFDLFL